MRSPLSLSDSDFCADRPLLRFPPPDTVLGVCADGPAKSFAYRRLKFLQSKFEMYQLLSTFCLPLLLQGLNTGVDSDFLSSQTSSAS